MHLITIGAHSIYIGDIILIKRDQVILCQVFAETEFTYLQLYLKAKWWEAFAKNSWTVFVQKSSTEQVLDTFKNLTCVDTIPQDFPFKEGKKKKKGNQVFTNTITPRSCQEAIECSRS